MEKLLYEYIDEFINEDIYNKAIKQVYPECKKKVLRTRNRMDQVRSLVAGLLLQRELSQYLNMDFEAIAKNMEISKNNYGKPYLKNYPDIFFNVSHNENIVVCALANTEIGVDVSRYSDAGMKIANRFFSKKDNIILNNCEKEEEKNKLFQTMWGIKESYLKLTGLGIGAGMDWFSVNYETKKISNENPLLDIPGEAGYNLFSLNPYIISICSYEKRKFDLERSHLEVER